MPNKKSNLLPKGFTTRSEKIAEGYRSDLSLQTHDPLMASALAAHLGVSICPISDYSKDVAALCNEWSGVTIHDSHGKPFIVHNSFHSPARQESTLMHELAHIICGHVRADQYEGIAIPSNLRDYNPQQEQEAAYLGGCLQLPRIALLHVFKKQTTEEQIAELYGASLQMVRYRIRITGVMNQVRRWHR